MPEFPETIGLVVTGILFGLGAAVFQSFSYVFSRRFLKECSAKPQHLFAMSHLLMGVMALGALPLLKQNPLPPLNQWAWYLIGTAGCYLLAQLFLFTALNRSDSSKIAPLLGLKIPTLAFLSWALFQDMPSVIAWFAIFLCVAAGAIISPPSGVPQIQVLLLVLSACLGYCISDLCIPHLVDALSRTSEHPTLLGVSLTYIACGAVGAIATFIQKIHRTPRIAVFAFPHALSWLIGISFLFACFATLGVVAGNMLQATRGIWSVFLGMAITAAGLLHIDDVSSRRVLVRRIIGAVIMTTSIVVYLHVEHREARTKSEQREAVSHHNAESCGCSVFADSQSVVVPPSRLVPGLPARRAYSSERLR